MKPRLFLVLLVVGLAVIAAMRMFRVGADVAEVGTKLPAAYHDDGALLTFADDPAPSASDASDEGETTAIVSPGTLPDDPLPLGAFAQNRATLESLARAGRADAASRLGLVLSACLGYVPKTPEQIELDAIAEVAGAAETLPDEQALKRAENRAAQRIERAVLCDGAVGLDDADRREGLDWLVRAANLGDPMAMAMRFDLELHRFGPNIDDVVDHSDELLALRPVAARMLRQAVDAGEPLALANMSRAHATGSLAPRDPVRARAFEIAWLVASRQRGLVREDPGIRLRGLDDAQRQEAERLALDVLAQCCTPP